MGDVRNQGKKMPPLVDGKLTQEESHSNECTYSVYLVAQKSLVIYLKNTTI